MPKRRPARTLLEVCVARRGMLRGARVAQFVAEWAIATADLGHEPTVTEFAHWWRIGSERTSWNRLAEFRRTFPELGEHGTPAPLVVPVVRAIEAKQAAAEPYSLFAQPIAV